MSRANLAVSEQSDLRST